jgi:hypothetical protein
LALIGAAIYSAISSVFWRLSASRRSRFLVPKNSKKIRIHIENATEGCGHTNLQHAKRLVKGGGYRWTDSGTLHRITAEEVMVAERQSVVPAWAICWRTAEAGILPWAVAS